ncbi:MAG TPA: alpha/beta hydrolase [Longimicrobiales bacterium]|nr:alpha/beta hydrolase [Longimicrobiales bacterium]
MQITRRFAHCNGIRIRYVESGSGPSVVFLHGFPDFSYSWRYQMPALTSAGYRCIAPDLRGYNESDKPPHVRDYRMSELVHDVTDFIANVAGGKAGVVGHDWGGVIGWHLAMQEPARVRRLVILNAPHPARLRQALRTPAQLLRFWYTGAFQIPFLPELVLSSLHFRLLTRAAARNEAEREIYEEALSQPGALTSALNYYRAAFRALVKGQAQPITRSTTPTLVLWGEKDRALASKLVEGLDRYVEHVEVRRFPQLGHWLHIDRPDLINPEIVNFLNAERSAVS